MAGLRFKIYFVALALVQIQVSESNGIEIGRFHSFMHGVKGYVSVLDEQTLEITAMTYDGEGPGSWFVVGNEDEKDYKKEWVELDATVIPDERNRCTQLRRYSGEKIKLRVPGKITDYSYLSIYCLEFNHNFGYIGIPNDLQVPPKRIGAKLKKPIKACEDLDTSPAAQNRQPTCNPWPACWSNPDDDEEDEDEDEDN